MNTTIRILTLVSVKVLVPACITYGPSFESGGQAARLAFLNYRGHSQPDNLRPLKV